MIMDTEALSSLMETLHDIKGVKFGEFTLKSGIVSPIYFDLRVIVSYPEIMKTVGDLMYKAVQDKGKFDLLCGVPYTALPIATCISTAYQIPMVMRRKEAKNYGTKQVIEGKYTSGQNCLIIEDVVTSGLSVLQTVEDLKSAGLIVTDTVVLLDREQGGNENLMKHGIKLHSLCNMTDLMKILQTHGRVSDDICKKVSEFIASNKCLLPHPKSAPVNQFLGFKERSELVTHPVTRNLLLLMEKKRTNLCVAADVTTSDKLLKIADAVGPYICVLKTHIDIVEDFNPHLCTQLKNLAEKHEFLIFEDRKFADIGNTVQLQYSKGIYQISEWADIINAHPLPGPGVVQGLTMVGRPKNRGCLLVAEMSSAGNLATKEYAQASLKMAEEFPDFVIGFISQSRISDHPKFVHFTPGVKMSGSESELLGQQYVTPECAIRERGADIIIIGRGIIEATNPAEAAMRYQKAGYEAFISSKNKM